MNSVDFFSGQMECEACKSSGTKRPGKMRFTGRRFVMELEDNRFWRFSVYEMECDKCGEKISSEGAGLRPGLRSNLDKNAIERI